MSRATLFKKEFVTQAEKLCHLGATDIEIADFFEVSPSTVKLWKSTHPDFAAALRVGKDVADERVARSLFNRAVGYSYEAVKIFKCKDEDPTIVPYREHVPPDVTACIFWLKNRRPEAWRDVQRHEVGKPGDFERMSDDELVREMQRESAELGLAGAETVQ